MRSPAAPALALLSLFLAVAAPAPGVRAEVFPSKVSRVVLYPDGAEVVRTVTVDPPAATVELKGIPHGLQPGSLSARVASGSATIVGFTVEDVFRAEPAAERVRELERKIEALSDAKRVAEGAIRSGRREQELLDQGILALYRGEPQPAPVKEKAAPARLTTAEIESALALFRARAEAIDAALLRQEQEVRSLDRRIAAARLELDQVRNPEPLRQKRIVVQLARPAACRIELSYQTSGAGFVPRYNVRLSPDTGALSFELVGDAWQRTGEDWTDASMSVSTSRPGRMAQLPPLPPWEIGFAVPLPPPSAFRELETMARSKAAGRPMVSAMPEDALEAPSAEEPSPPQMPAAVRRFASFEVALDGPQSLPGSGERKSLLLSRSEQKGSVSWLSIPPVAEGAFVTAEGENGTGLPLLSAPVALFLEDAFVGNGSVTDPSGRPAEIPEGAAFRIGFGKDPSLQAVRKERLRQQDEGGVFGRVKRVRFRYEYAVSNFRKEGASLTLLDRIPVSRDKEVQVKDVEAPGAKVGSKEPGEVRWELSLAPGEKKTLSLSFVVEYPADKEVDGL